MKPSLRRLQLRHWALVAAAIGVALLVGRPGAGGVALGGVAIGLSVLLTAAGLRAVLLRSGPRLAIGLLSVKLLLLLGLGWLAFAKGVGRPDPIGFALGVSCFPISAVWEALRVRGG